MFSAIQAAIVWFATAMLCLQTICPGLVSQCGCQRSASLSCCVTNRAQRDCCRVSQGRHLSPTCPHCDESSSEGTLSPGAASVCHCERALPPRSHAPIVPESTDSTSQPQLTCATHSWAVTPPVLSSTLAQAQVPSWGFLVPRFKQLVHSVWLT